MRRRDLVRHLQAHGCALLREGHSHSIFENPQSRRRTSLPRHREIPDPLARVICRQLGIPEP